jgi:CheY-like chemotaxis protein
MDSKWPLILVVEDSPTQAIQIASILSSHKVRVVIANDGLQGLRLIHSQLPDLIVLDVNLPKMDGYQMCNRLKRDPETADIPVVMMTAMVTPEATLRGMEVGASDFLTKDSLTRENLFATVNKYLHIVEQKG